MQISNKEFSEDQKKLFTRYTDQHIELKNQFVAISDQVKKLIEVYSINYGVFIEELANISFHCNEFFKKNKVEVRKGYYSNPIGSINALFADFERGQSKQYTSVLLAWMCCYHPEEAEIFYNEKLKLVYHPYDYDVGPSYNGGKPSHLKVRRDRDPSYKKVNPDLLDNPYSLPENLLKIKKGVDDTFTLFLDDHEKHDIEKKFISFTENSSCGYWLLSAGPGMGKTALLGNLSKELSLSYLCISYIFRLENYTSPTNLADTFLNYTIDFLLTRFNYDEKDLPSRKPLSVQLISLLYSLSEAGQINNQYPVYIVIDGLDEMTNGYHFEDNPNPLGWTPNLPEGVYIIQSLRIKKNEIKNNNKNLPPFDEHSILDEDSEDHQKTVNRYIDRIYSNVDLQKYLQYSKMSELCEKSKFNFMIIKSVLHDPTFWESPDFLYLLTSDLEEYYQGHFERMKNNVPKTINAYAPVCFALRLRISFFSFANLLSNNVYEGNQLSNVEKLLDNWKKQGLVTESNEGLSSSFSAYHKSYHDFLITEFQKLNYEHRDQFIVNFTKGINLEGDFSEIRNVSNYLLRPTKEFHEEWVDLSIRLCVLSDNTSILKQLLCNLQFWILAAQTKEKVGLISRAVGGIPVTNDNAEHYKSVFRQCVKKTSGWVNDGKIHSGDQNYNIVQFRDAAKHACPEMDTDQIWLADYITDNKGGKNED